MLVKFSVSNFKNFKDKIELDLESAASYDFNDMTVRDRVVSKALVLGKNGCGKTNLALALFDIVLNLTDNERAYDKYAPYRNMDSDVGEPVVFEYVFVFDGTKVVYSYAKKDAQTLIYERLTIGDKEVVQYDFALKKGHVGLPGTKNLDLSAEENPMSRVKYVKSNALLPKDPVNDVFLSFMKFVNGMLMFYSLNENRYQGFRIGPEDCLKGIIRNGGMKDFEKFLREYDIDYNLVAREFNGSMDIFCRFKSGDVRFRDIASTGTNSLAIFYYWYMLLDKVSFVYIDEFDAFYHHGLAESVVKTLKGIDAQVILSTHDTDIISNELLRPDCYFVIKDGKIKSFDRLTEMEIREEFDMQRMYKAGVFNG